MSNQPGIVARKLRVVVEVDRDTAYIFDNRLSTALNRLGFLPKEATGYGTIFMRGLEILEKEWKEQAGKANKWAYYGEELEQEESEKTEKRFLARMYETKGLDKFVEWCKVGEIDWESFLVEYDLVRQTKAVNKSDLYRLFLERTLRGRGPVASEQVRRLAEEDGVVTTEDDWKFMRVIASRDGLTAASHGYWIKE